MRIIAWIAALALLATVARAQTLPATLPEREGKLPHLDVDVKQKRVRVECESLRVEAPLEFFCVLTGTSEHESVLRSSAKASDLHLALLMIGLEPGSPLSYSEEEDKWLPPHGPPLEIHCEFERDGQTVTIPAYQMMRNVKTREPMPRLTWIFAGSRVMEDGNYAADVTGYLVSVVNFDLTVIDVSQLASNANETLEWETNLDVVPPRGAKVTMIIEPAEQAEVPASQPAMNDDGDDDSGAAGSSLDQPEIDLLRQRWLDAVRPRGDAIRDAARAHHEVISELRQRQQRLIEDADRVQNLIDELEENYRHLTSPSGTEVEED